MTTKARAMIDRHLVVDTFRRVEKGMQKEVALTPAQMIAVLVFEFGCGGSRGSQAEIDAVMAAPPSRLGGWVKRARRAIRAAQQMGAIRVRADGCLVVQAKQTVFPPEPAQDATVAATIFRSPDDVDEAKVLEFVGEFSNKPGFKLDMPALLLLCLLEYQWRGSVAPERSEIQARLDRLSDAQRLVYEARAKRAISATVIAGLIGVTNLGRVLLRTEPLDSPPLDNPPTVLRLVKND